MARSCAGNVRVWLCIGMRNHRRYGAVRQVKEEFFFEKKNQKAFALYAGRTARLYNEWVCC
jgi:hypothetical protein